MKTLARILNCCSAWLRNISCLCLLSFIINSTSLFAQTQAISVWAYPDKATLVGEANIGMVAYHSTGINRVEFSFNGSEAQEVNDEILNAETGEYEFVFNINTTEYADGEYSITATAYPNDGVARELPLLNVYIANNTPGNNWYVDADNGNDANTGTSAGEAFETIEEALNNAVGGDNIYLATGNYELPGDWNNAFDRYVTLQSAPDEEPKITATNTMHKDLLKFIDIMFDFSTQDISVNIIFSHLTGHLWFNNCQFEGVGKENFNNDQTAFRIFNDAGHVTVENCRLSGLNRAFVVGGIGRNIIRNNLITDMAGDIFNPGSEMLISGNEIYGTKAPNLFIESTGTTPFDLSLAGDFRIHHCEATNTCDSADYNVYEFTNLAGEAANSTAVTVDELVSALNANISFYEYCWAENYNGNVRIYSRRNNYVQQMWVDGAANNALLFAEDSYQNEAEGSGMHSDVLQYWGVSGTYDTISNLIFRNNKAYNNESQGIFPGECIHTEGLAIVNNLVDKFGKDGWNVSFDYSSDEGEKFNNVLFEHNTLWDGGTCFIVEDTTSTNMTFRNNIFGRRYMGEGDVFNTEGSICDYNMYYWYYWQAPPSNEHSVVIEVEYEDPIELFTNVVLDTLTEDESGDFSLTWNSPARDVGSSASGIKYDINWNLRDNNPDMGAYEYTTGTNIFTASIEKKESFRIYPNPFVNNTTIEYSIPENADVEISLYNMLGKKVKIMFKGYQQAGDHILEINNNISAGTYYYKLKAGNYSAFKKCIAVH